MRGRGAPRPPTWPGCGSGAGRRSSTRRACAGACGAPRSTPGSGSSSGRPVTALERARRGRRAASRRRGGVARPPRAARDERVPGAGRRGPPAGRPRLRLRARDRAADRRAACGRSAGRAARASATRANQFHYYRLTTDDRILWGGYDAIYHYGNRRRAPSWSSSEECFAAALPALLHHLPAARGHPLHPPLGRARSTPAAASSPSTARRHGGTRRLHGRATPASASARAASAPASRSTCWPARETEATRCARYAAARCPSRPSRFAGRRSS